MRRHLAILLPVSLLATALTAAVAVSSVQAVGGTGEYAAWTRTGSTGTMTLAADDFAAPSATWTTTGSSLDVPSGASTWLGPTTPFGAYFGSSQGKPYLNVGTGGAVSVTTTYTFADPTPAGTWGFALGDIDADKVKISATDAGGNAVAVSSWYQGVFNYCAVSPKPSGCPAGTHTDVPVWNGIDTLTGNGSDTSGASGWFRPTQSIKTLTFTFEKLSGFPIFQTWFAADEPAPSPSPSPTSTSASPSPTETSASPSPTETSASPSPTSTSPSPSPTSTSPSPSPTETSASPSPSPTETSASPTPEPTPTPTPTPSPTPEPTPTPTPSPTPEPQEPTEPVVLPQVIANPGTTVIVEGPIETNAGNTVKVTVTCKTYVRSGDRATPRGDYELCTVRKYAKRGKVTLTTYGNPVKVVVNLNAPATDGYAAYKQVKKYNVR